LKTQWFGNDAEFQQQMGWWQSEYDKAVAAGDRQRQQELEAERDAVIAASQSYQNQQPGFNAYDQAWSQYNALTDLRGEGFNRKWEPAPTDWTGVPFDWNAASYGMTQWGAPQPAGREVGLTDLGIY